MTTANPRGTPVSRLSSKSAVFFDLDGTLLDTAPDFRAVIQQLCESRQICPPSAEAVDATVSSGARALLTLALKIAADHADFPALLQQLLDAYGLQIQNSQAVLYPGMESLLQRLEQQAIPWGVVTNKPERFTVPLLEGLGLAERCAVLVCPDHVQYTKPHPEPLLLACARTNCRPEHSIYVGDHPRDIDAGRAAGMTTIAAGYGYLPDSIASDYLAIEHWQADLIVASVQDIIDYFWPHSQA